MIARVLRPLGRDLRGALDDDVRASVAGIPSPQSVPVTEADIAGLPVAAQRYLRFMGAVGRARDHSFRAHGVGHFRMKPGQRFMPSEFWQFNALQPVVRLFHMRIDFAGFVPMVGRDSYVDGHGAMRGRLLGVVPVANGSGPEFDTGELTTYLNDGILIAPSMLLVPAVTWTEVSNDLFDVALTDADRTVTARVAIDERGAPLDFWSADRYAALPSGLTRAEWSTPVREWTVIDGRAQMRAAAAVWHLPDGPFTYAEFEFARDAFEFDVGITTYRDSDAS